LYIATLQKKTDTEAKKTRLTYEPVLETEATFVKARAAAHFPFPSFHGNNFTGDGRKS
jgi:hypothetical protein